MPVDELVVRASNQAENIKIKELSQKLLKAQKHHFWAFLKRKSLKIKALIFSTFFISKVEN